MAALAGVLCLIWLIQRLVRWGRPHSALAALLPQAARSSGRLRLVQSLPIDTSRRIVLFACDDREMLLLVGGSADVVLAALPGSATGGAA
jgi:flagellar biogenesis protein FliO